MKEAQPTSHLKILGPREMEVHIVTGSKARRSRKHLPGSGGAGSNHRKRDYIKK